MDVSSVSEYQESTTIRFDWTLRGLKSLFDSSKGESKSKVTKSVRFEGGRWQILFYANSGNANSEGQGYVSLYLSCEPTTEEKESAINGKWIREGSYNFLFELRNLQKTILFNTKEAHDHSFSYRTQNWGWAQFARRDAVYYKQHMVLQQDAFLISCTISSSPAAPAPPPSIPRQFVPKDLLDAMGSLLDDAMYSDVEFILPRRGRVGKGARRIYAARRLLRRVEYFDTMFHAGFLEASPDTVDIYEADAQMADETSSNATETFTRQFEDSDDEEDDDEDNGGDVTMTMDDRSDSGLGHSLNMQEDSVATVTEDPQRVAETGTDTGSWTTVSNLRDDLLDADEHAQQQRNVRAKLSHPSTPRARILELQQDGADKVPSNPSLLGGSNSIDSTSRSRSPLPGPRKAQVVVRDVAYATYRAVLYYIYTDTIVFAPLSSSFFTISAPTPQPSTIPSTPTAIASESQASFALGPRSNQQQEGNGASSSNSSSIVPASRREWIAQWERNNPGKPRPSSAKAVYRLADKLDLQELKERAFQHIIKSLTVDNVAYEVFSTFSAAFEDVRKVQVRFFLDNWVNIRASDSMRNVWQQIRLGRHPGFEEVWPAIAESLEFKPRTADAASGNGKEVTAGYS